MHKLYQHIPYFLLLEQSLRNKSMNVVAVPGTPLQKLIEAVPRFTADGVFKEGNGLAGLAYDELLASLSKNIAHYVDEHMSFARNVARPLIVELSTKVTTSAKSQTSVASLYSMDRVALPDILNTVLRAEVNAFAQAGDVNGFKSVGLPTLEFTDLQARVCRESDSAELSRWLALQPENFLENVWARYFGSNVELTRSSHAQYFTPPELAEKAWWAASDHRKYATCTNTLIAVYLIADSLYKDPLENVKMGLTAWRALMQTIRAFAGSLIYKHIQTYAKDISDGRVFLNRTPHENSAVVNSTSFDMYITQGGTTDHALAAIHADPDVNPSLTWMLRNDERLKEKWTSLISAQIASDTINHRSRVKQFMADAVDDYLSNPGNSVLEYAQEIPNWRAVAKQKVVDILEDHRVFKDGNIMDLAVRVVCDGIFFFTAAGAIIHFMNSVYQDKPDITAEQAAQAARVMYITDFVTDMLRV